MPGRRRKLKWANLIDIEGDTAAKSVPTNASHASLLLVANPMCRGILLQLGPQLGRKNRSVQTIPMLAASMTAIEQQQQCKRFGQLRLGAQS